MNNKITNPYLKQLISGIATKATVGRTDLSWGMLSEAKKKKMMKMEAEIPKKPDDEENVDAPAQEPVDAPKPEAPAQEVPANNDAEEIEAAKNDLKKSEDELNAAKAEKEKAETDIKSNAHVSLNSSAGVEFLLGKLLDHAFKTNTIDSLAGEMIQKLKIQTPEDMSAFGQEVAPYRVLPGMPELLTSMEGMATKQPATPDDSGNEMSDEPPAI